MFMKHNPHVQPLHGDKTDARCLASVRRTSSRHFDPACRDDNQILRMHQAFRATGGLLSLNEVICLFRRFGGPNADQLSDWMRTQAVIAFDWRDERWLPMFQFSRNAMAVHQALRPVLRELFTIHDGWETANWFALPNSWLGERAPVDLLVHDLTAVWYAARCDRFVARGDSTGDLAAMPATALRPTAAGVMC